MMTRLMGYRSAALVLGVMLFCAAPRARAGYVGYEVTRARLSMQRADCLMSEAELAAAEARADYESSDRRAADVASEIDRKQAEVDDLGRRVDDGDRAIRWLREDLNRHLDRLDARQKDLDAPRERVARAREALDKLTAEGAAEFEKSDAFRAADADARQASDALKAAEDAAVTALEQTEQHKALIVAVEAAQKRVDFLTDQGERAAAELDAAKKELDQAKRRVGELEDRQVDADPQVKAARERLDVAAAKVNTLRDEFDKEYARRPEVADARKAVDEGQNAYDAALRDVRDAEDRVADARTELQRQEDALAADRNRLREADDTLRAMVDDVRDAGMRADDARARYEDAVGAAECARRERQAAYWALARAEQSDAFCGWDASPWGYGSYSWTFVHIRRIQCDDDDDFHRRRHFGFRPGVPGLFGPPVPRVWGPRPRPVVVVKVFDGGSRADRLARERAREKARELASRHAGDEQRQQRLAAIEARRHQSLQRQAQRVAQPVKIVGDRKGVQLVGGRSDAAQRALAQFPIAQAGANERAARKEAANDNKAERVAAAKTQRDVRGEARQAFELRRRQEREQLAAAQKSRQPVTQSGSESGPGSARVRGGREADSRSRERGNGETSQASGQQVAQSKGDARAEREAARQQEAASAQAERSRRRLDLEAARVAAEQKQDAARDVARQERDQRQQAGREQVRQEVQHAREARESRPQRPQQDDAADRQRDAQARVQRQSEESARDSARQRDVAAAREGSQQREAMRQAQHEAQRESVRQAAQASERQRSSERESQRAAQRESPRETQRQSESRGERSGGDDRAGRRNR